MGHLGVVLYEYQGEAIEVLGSILGALKAIARDRHAQMTPPIKDLLPRCAHPQEPHETVQNCIDLVSRIADRGAEFVSAREWMRICFELLDMLKAHRRPSARRQHVWVLKAIGRRTCSRRCSTSRCRAANRVCTTVAIAIVAETCRPSPCSG